MSETTLGKCEPCGVVYAWPARKAQPLKGALCHACRRPLERTTYAVCRRLRVHRIEAPAREGV